MILEQVEEKDLLQPLFEEMMMVAGKCRVMKLRYGVLTTSRYHPELITTLDQATLAAKGFMQSRNDWKDIEMTGYFKVNSFTDSTRNGAAHVEFVARGGRIQTS